MSQYPKVPCRKVKEQNYHQLKKNKTLKEKTLFSPVYSSSENMHYPVLARIQLIAICRTLFSPVYSSSENYIVLAHVHCTARTIELKVGTYPHYSHICSPTVLNQIVRKTDHLTNFVPVLYTKVLNCSIDSKKLHTDRNNLVKLAIQVT